VSRPAAGDDSPGRPGDPDRSRELARRPGWAWTRLFRRYDHYAATIDRIERNDGEREHAAEREPAPAR
jgi:hypothetical protein